jgi:MFS transporter, CP family, cyanate transporter
MRHAVRLREHNARMTHEPSLRPRAGVMLALVMVAFNLRQALSSVPAVESDIESATGWSSAAIGALTTIPVICMGAFALLVPRVARRLGRRHTVALALGMLTVALAMRLAAMVSGVLAVSALLAGVGIALAGGLVPRIVREQLPTNVGAATGLWTAAMMTGAALGGALTVPLAEVLGSWNAALAIWAVPAGIGLVVWWVVERGHEEPGRSDVVPVRIRELPWRDRRAWSLTAFLTCNSIVFYTALAWLAPSYVDRGWTPAHAGLLLGAFTASQVVAALFMPAVAERAYRRRALFAGLVAVAAISLALIAWRPDTLPVVVVIVFGAALGGGFAMALALLSEFAIDGQASARLTAMAYSVTYLTAASGPLIAGALLDRFDSWLLVFALLSAVCLAQLATIPALRRGVRIG